MTRDIQASILRACARFLTKRLEPVELRLKGLEDRGQIIHKGMDGSHGRDGKDGAPGLRGEMGERGEKGLDGVDGKPGPMGERGPAGEKGEKGERGADGAPGARGDVGPRGEKGIDGTPGPEGRPGVDGKDGSPGLHGKDGRDGIDGKDGAPGLHGKDGSNGLNGKDADEDAIVRRVLASVDAMVQKAISAMPVPRDGRDGLPGVPGLPGEKGIDGRNGTDGLHGSDGLSLEDFDAFMKDDGRTLVIKLCRGELVREKELRLDVPIYRGVFEREKAYQKGDTVTYGGSCWQAMSDDPVPPGDGKGWRLMVKRGADAK